jgi:hypothetical protein
VLGDFKNLVADIGLDDDALDEAGAVAEGWESDLA